MTLAVHLPPLAPVCDLWISRQLTKRKQNFSEFSGIFWYFCPTFKSTGQKWTFYPSFESYDHARLFAVLEYCL